MKKINDYQCTNCNFIFEDLEENTCSCPMCSNLAKKIMSPVRFHLEGVSGSFPTAADKWAKSHERAAKHREGREDWQ